MAGFAALTLVVGCAAPIDATPLRQYQAECAAGNDLSCYNAKHYGYVAPSPAQVARVGDSEGSKVASTIIDVLGGLLPLLHP